MSGGGGQAARALRQHVMQAGDIARQPSKPGIGGVLIVAQCSCSHLGANQTIPLLLLRR